MKRQNEKVPEFDEIIFENRNKNYGAYRLRKAYKSTTSISILGAVGAGALLISALSLTTEKSTADTPPVVVTLFMSDPILPKITPPPVIKPPASVVNTIRNLKPEVTEDTTEITPYLPTTDDINATIKNAPIDTIQTTVISDPVVPKETEPFISVEEPPEFPGGIPALMKFIGENIKYPEEAAQLNVQGKVSLKFVVKPDGSTDRIEITRGVDPLLDNEAVRVVGLLPKFKPGKQSGVAVPVWFSLPVNFRLENN
jgi:periplasmic protein TonB